MPKTWSIQDAKDHFSEVVTAARKSPQTVTKHGKPAVVVVDAQTFENLAGVPQDAKPSFVEHLLAIPKGEPFQRGKLKFRNIKF